MPTAATLLAFAAVATGLVITPGPNTLYMLSRAITQGPVAGLISLAGVVTGFFLLHVRRSLRPDRDRLRGALCL